jgi:Xaa-Pro aminopeptidase
MSYFDTSFFVANRRALQKRCQAGVPIVLTANGLLQRGADSTFNFSQDANFWYVTGIDEPDVTLVMDGDDEFLMVPDRESTREAFDGAVDNHILSVRSGVAKVVDEATGWKRLDSLLEKHGKVLTPAAAPQYLQDHGIYTNPSRARLLEHMQQHVPEVQILDIRAELAHMRMVKQPQELAALRAAINITSDTLNELLTKQQILTYEHEYQLEADVFRGFRQAGATGHSFEPIVAGGKNACTLHNVANRDALAPNTLVVCDVGAEVEHYAADITRTVAYGKPTARQKAVYQAVAEVQAQALTMLKPGTLLRDYEDKVALAVGRQLKALGLIKRLEKGAVRKYFPHSTSHYLGLNVHDVGDYTRPLEPGVVLTCEPGIYIPEEGIGVRIEDDVLITEKGNEVLSAACRKALV